MSEPSHQVHPDESALEPPPTARLRVVAHDAVPDCPEADGVGLLAGRLFVRDVRGTIVPVSVAHIERLEAQDDYVRVVTRERRYLMAARLGELAERLRPFAFLRVHRSHVVNLDFVERLVPFDSKRLEVRLRDGTRILASRLASEMIRRHAR
jgi:DNA-binding LytR/AlgR family response regulator